MTDPEETEESKKEYTIDDYIANPSLIPMPSGEAFPFLPPGLTPPPGMQPLHNLPMPSPLPMPPNMPLPPGFQIPQPPNLPLPPSAYHTQPQNIPMPPGFPTPSPLPLPPHVSLPPGYQIPQPPDLPMPPGFQLNEGTGRGLSSLISKSQTRTKTTIVGAPQVLKKSLPLPMKLDPEIEKEMKALGNSTFENQDTDTPKKQTTIVTSAKPQLRASPRFMVPLTLKRKQKG